MTTMMTTADPSFDLRHTLTRPSPSRTVSPTHTDPMEVDFPHATPVVKDRMGDDPSSHSEPSSTSRTSHRHREDIPREKDKDKDRERERDKDRDRDRDRERERDRDRDRRYRDPDYGRDYDRDHRRRYRDDYDDHYGPNDRYIPSSSSSRSRRGYDDYDRDRRYEDERRRERYSRRRPSPPPRDRDRDRDRDRHRDESRNGLNRPAPVPDLPQTERDQRTVFVAQLHLQARPKDIADFFEKLDAGSVRDVKLVADRGSRRGKGVGFVEFYELDSVEKALGLAGQSLLGVPIIVERTEAEKNRLALAAAAEKSKLLAQANAVAAVQGMRHLTTTSNSPGPTSVSNTPRSLAKGIASLPPRPSFMTDKLESISKTLCVDKLPVNLTSSDIRQIFEPFGVVTNVHLVTDHDAKSTGTAHIYFADIDACQNALNGLKGFVIGEHEIICSPLVEQVPAAQGGGEPEELEEKAGVRLNAQSRVELMTKLARAKNVPVPTLPAGPSIANTISPNENNLSTLHLSANNIANNASVSSVAHATRCLLLTNMFDPTQETEPDWGRDIEMDVKGECERQYGPVRHIHLVKDSAGLVFLKFSSIDACSRALSHLNGRLFAGNRISASYVIETEYNDKFPDAAAL